MIPPLWPDPTPRSGRDDSSNFFGPKSWHLHVIFPGQRGQSSVVEELKRLFETMFARMLLRVLETNFTSMLTPTKVNILAYFMLFIDIFNAFVAL